MENVKEKNNLLFYCYDKNLYEKLRFTANIPSLMTALHVKTYKQFWVFQQSQELTDALAKFKNHEL